MGQELQWLAQVLPPAAEGDWGPYENTGTPMRNQVRQVLPILQIASQMDPSLAAIVDNVMKQFEPIVADQVAMLALMFTE
jgi:hypothetical protein